MRMVSDAMGQIGGQDGLSVRGFACFTPFGDSFCCGGQLVFFVGVGLLFVLVAFAVLWSVGGGVFVLLLLSQIGHRVSVMVLPSSLLTVNLFGSLPYALSLRFTIGNGLPVSFEIRRSQRLKKNNLFLPALDMF